MAYSASLAQRIREALAQTRGVVEKRMFGGLGFLLHGNMLVGVWKNSLVGRLGPDEGNKALAEPYVKAFDVTGKPMKGWVLVEPEGVDNDHQLRRWLERSIDFVETLPRK